MAIAQSSEEIISKLKDLKEKETGQFITENEIIQIKSFENDLSNKFEESASTESFYSLPFETFLSIVSQTDFSVIKQPSKTIYEIIEKSIQYYSDDSILLLQNIHIPSESITIDEYFRIIGLFSNSQILNQVSRYYEPTMREIDQYEEIIKKQESYIKTLESNLQNFQNSSNKTTSKTFDEEKNTVETFKHNLMSFQTNHSFASILDINQTKYDSFDSVEINQNSTEILQNIQILQQLPLQKIFALLSETDFYQYSSHDESFQALKTYISNIIKAHLSENELILMLQYLPTYLMLSEEEIFSVFSLLSNCPFLQYFCDLHNKDNCPLDRDLEYELSEKSNEIKLIRNGIFKFCADGDLKSIQTLISMDVDYNIQDEHGTPLHYACLNGHLPVVEFLISKGLDPNCKNKYG